MKQSAVNWPCLERPLVEQYVDNHLAIVCDLHVSLTNQSELGRWPAGEDRSKFRQRQFRAVLCFCADIPDGRHLQLWNQVLMFVSDVQVVKSPDAGIRSIVGLYDIQDEISDRLERRGYLSLADGISHTNLGLMERKPCVRAGRGELRNKLVPDEVESGMKVVDSITNGEHDFLRNGLLRREQLQDIASKVRCEFDENGMGVFVDVSLDFRIELLNVLIGPTDL